MRFACSACSRLPLLLSGRKRSSRRRGGRQHQRRMGKLSCTAGAPRCVLIGPRSPLPRYQMPSHEIWIRIRRRVVIIENKPKPEQTELGVTSEHKTTNLAGVFYFTPIRSLTPFCITCNTRYLRYAISRLLAMICV